MFEKCPECGSERIRCEKHTFTGRDLRDWCCIECGWTKTVDQGIALWKAMSEANQESEQSEVDHNSDSK